MVGIYRPKRLRACGRCEQYRANVRGFGGIGRCGLGREAVQYTEMKNTRGQIVKTWEVPMFPGAKRFCDAFVPKDYQPYV